MPSAARKLNHSTEVEEWVDTLFDGQEGFVYVPTKNPKTGHWQPYFYKYPSQKNEIVTHVMGATGTKEVYMAPSLFSEPDAKRENWYGTNYVWAEFDGNAPSESLPQGIPNPTYRIRSSTKGHEHWYWRLDEFVTDRDIIQGLTKRLSYTLSADKSGWDANQVLRPPGTLHHDTSRRVVLLAAQNGTVSIGDFAGLVTAPEEVVINTTIDTLPDVKEVTQKYKFPKDARDLFNKKEQPVGSRSSAMTRMAFHCIEMGMTNEEAYVILINCDDRWGKYKTRTPESRAKVLTGLINHVRNEKAIKAEIRLNDYEPMYSIKELLELDFSKIKWTYDEVLAENSLSILAADPDTGKTTFALQMGLSIAIGKDFLGWDYGLELGQNVGFFSYEMDARQCGHFLSSMYQGYNSAEQLVLDSRFFVRPTGYSIPLDHKDEQQKFLDYVDKHELQFLIIDSLKAVNGLEDRKTDSVMQFINKDLRSDRGCTVLAIHHNRKATTEGRQPEQSLADLYGDVFIQATAVHVVALRTKSKNQIEVAQVKNRLAPHFKPFRIARTDHMAFKVADNDNTNSSGDKPKGGLAGTVGL